jgi:outer membrane protein assembly factor BamB
MIGVSCADGRVLWETPNPNKWKMSHSSIVPMTICGTRMYVYAAAGGVVAVRADGPRAGEILWATPEWTTSVVMPSPVLLSDDRVFLTSGYGGGCAVLKVTKEGDAFSVKTVYNYRAKRPNDPISRKCFSCYQQTPIHHKGRLFGIQSNDAKEHAMEFVCVDPNVSGGKLLWWSGPEPVFTAHKKREAWGPWILADNKFYVAGDSGLLAVFAADTERCNLLGSWQIMSHGHEVWGPMAIVSGRLLIRDLTRLMCFDLRKERAP